MARLVDNATREERSAAEAWGTLGRLAERLGSTLDVDEVAARSLQILETEFGFTDAVFCLLDEEHHRLEIKGPVPGSWSRADDRWSVGRELQSRLAGRSVFLRFDPEDLPLEIVEPSGRVAIRLTDAGVTVGFVLVLGSRAVESVDPTEETMLRALGALLGSTVSRALIHRALVEVTEHLETAQRLQQHILDHVSHEFNTPLMIMKSAAEFADTDDREERSQFLDMHRQATDRLEGLVQGVLEVARSGSAGRMTSMSLDEFDRAVVAPLFEIPRWPAERVRRWNTVESDRRLRVDADGLSLALEHLLRNAWSFGGQDGARAALCIYLDRRARWTGGVPTGHLDEALEALGACRSWEPPVDSRVDTLVIEVVDDGMGIPEDEFEFVFEPFTQASNSPLRAVSGAGMGLPTCRKRVQSMGGEVRLVSAEGRGTAVALLLPLRPEERD